MYNYILLFESQFYRRCFNESGKTQKEVDKEIEEELDQVLFRLVETDPNFNASDLDLSFENKTYVGMVERMPKVQKILAYYREKCPEDTLLYYKLFPLRSMFNEPLDPCGLQGPHIMENLAKDVERGAPLARYQDLLDRISFLLRREIASGQL